MVESLVNKTKSEAIKLLKENNKKYCITQEDRDYYLVSFKDNVHPIIFLHIENDKVVDAHESTFPIKIDTL